MHRTPTRAPTIGVVLLVGSLAGTPVWAQDAGGPGLTHHAILDGGPRSSGMSPDPGQDARFVSRIRLSALLGLNWPAGDMNVVLDPGMAASGRGEYSLGPSVRVGAQLGFHSFDAERPGTRDNEGIVSLSLFGKALGTWGPYRPYTLLGVGGYVSKESDSSRRWDAGLQFGAGIELPLSEVVAAVMGGGLHLIFRGAENDDYLWLDGHFGLLFRVP